MQQPVLHHIDELSKSCYVDACVMNERDDCIFLSVLGNYSLLQQFRARIVLPRNHDQALSVITIDYHTLFMDKSLQSHIAKLNHASVQSLAHLIVYAPVLIKADKQKKIAYVMQQDHESPSAYHVRLWNTIYFLSDVPLLPDWRKVILRHLLDDGSIIKLDEYYGDIMGRVQRCSEIKLKANFGDKVSELLQRGLLQT